MTKDEALRLALEALENTGLKWPQVEEAITAIKAALEAKDKPVAWYDSVSGWTDFHSFKPTRKPSSPSAEWLPLYATPPQQEAKDEPVACKECHLKDTVYDLLGDLKVANLKLSVRSQRTWVGLTDEDEIPWDGVDAKSFAKAIEAKLKEKNT